MLLALRKQSTRSTHKYLSSDLTGRLAGKGPSITLSDWDAWTTGETSTGERGDAQAVDKRSQRLVS